MTTLNFGGTRFIGRRVTDQLAADGEEVICVDVRADDEIDHDGIRVVEGDVTDADAVMELFERHEPERVLNLASYWGRNRAVILRSPSG